MGREGYRALLVWQRAKALAVSVYNLTNSGVFERDYGMKDQVRRAAVSVCSNIAEGDERGTDKDAVHFFYIAKGSLAELATQLEISHEVKYLSSEQYRGFQNKCLELGKMLGALIKARSKSARIRT